MAWKWSSVRDDSKCLSLCVCRMEWRFHETGWAYKKPGPGWDRRLSDPLSISAGSRPVTCVRLREREGEVQASV